MTILTNNINRFLQTLSNPPGAVVSYSKDTGTTREELFHDWKMSLQCPQSLSRFLSSFQWLKRMIAKHWDVQSEGKSFVCIWNPWISYMGMYLQMKSVQVLYQRVCEGTMGKKVSPPCYFRPHAFTESNEISVTDTSSCHKLHNKFSSNMLSLPQLLRKSPLKSSKGAAWYFGRGTPFPQTQGSTIPWHWGQKIQKKLKIAN